MSLYNYFTAIVIGFWFMALYVPARSRRSVVVAEQGTLVPGAILLSFFFLPSLFLVMRTDGTAVLEDGFTTSNMITLAIVGAAAAYLLHVIRLDRQILSFPNDISFQPIYLFAAWAMLSSTWSVVPQYTLFRAFEFIVLLTVSLILFTRSDFSRTFVSFNVALIIIWLGCDIGVITENLSRGVFFSCGKNNLTPLICLFILSYILAFPDQVPKKGLIIAICVVGFIVGGSAATTAAIPLMVTGFMAASDRPLVRRFGWVACAIYLSLNIYLLVGLKQYPELMEFLAALLQKPIEELEKNTGRSEFWPAFIEAAQGRLFGSGYAAGERFIQLVDYEAVRKALGDTPVLIKSAHNAVIGAWVSLGWVGIYLFIGNFADPCHDGVAI